ncbi:MAG TPA: DUF3419 family protein [Saprospiraceae bacterium]|nr:DUF3419 family protein [Saprospiraceae bacterium]
MNNPLKYSNCWEDAFLLGKALRINGSSNILSVASAGDNSFYLLHAAPASLVCIDLNEVQLHVTQLKETAIRRLPREDYLAFVGFTESRNRWSVFELLSPELPAEATAFFRKNPDLIHKGIVHQGKFEGYFRLFARYILPLIHSKRRIEGLMQPKSAAEQQQYYTQKWNTWRWRALFRIFFSRAFMGKFGREPEKMKHVEGSVGELIFQMAERHLQSTACQHNYILRYTLTGSFGQEYPPYVLPDYYHAIQKWLQTNRIQYHLATFEEAIAQYPQSNRFNLSNIFEYMDIPAFEHNIQRLDAYAPIGSVVAYWNLMVPRIIRHESWTEASVPNTPDLGFFYQKFNVFEK